MTEKIKTFIDNEIRGWHTWEIIWISLASAIIIGLSVYWRDTWFGIISSTTGVLCVVCTGKGKLSAYIFGLINSVMYAIIAYHATYYGETMLNAIYYVPMQFVGFYLWSKNMDPETHEVKKVHMTNLIRTFVLSGIVIATVLYGFILKKMCDALPFVDSFTTVCSVAAMIISVKMFSEQWWIWVAVNIVTIYMWWTDFSTGQENIATLLMWIVYLGNSIIMLVKWEMEICKNKRAGQEELV